MAKLIEYKCPKCGGIVEFDSSLQQMKCPYCDSVFSVDAFSENESVLENINTDDFEYDDSGNAWEAREDGYGLYHCDTCGAEIIADETTASMHCPYCDNPIILTGRLAGELKPDLIIPFKLDKSAAKSALATHLKGKKLLPKVFTSQNHLDEVKGIYVPFWLFDTDADVSASYEMKKTRIWSDSRNQYTETSIFQAERSGSMSFSNVPVDGSVKMDNALMESLEAYDCSEAVAFKTAYLSGYFANRYDVPAEECKKRAKERVFESACTALDATVTGYDSVRKTRGNANLSQTSVRYALFPVWILNTTWHDTKYTFAMNGQTGKFVGNLPIDKMLYLKYRLLYALCFGGGIFAINWLAGMFL